MTNDAPSQLDSWIASQREESERKADILTGGESAERRIARRRAEILEAGVERIDADDATRAGGARTDAHKPSAFEPNDYVWVAYQDEGDSECPGLFDGDADAIATAEATGQLNAIHPGGCDVCGQGGLRYRYFYRHEPTGDVVVLGSQCVERMGFDSREAFAAHKRAMLEQERRIMAAAAKKWAAENTEVANFLEAVYEGEVDCGRASEFVLDVRRKLIQYGSLSEKQTEAIAKVASRQAEFEAKRAEEAEKFSPIPAEVIGKRVVITGEILTMKWQENQFGGSEKMLVLDDRGFKVWGSVPSALTEVGNQAVVRFADGHEEVLSNNALYGRPEDAEIVRELPVAEKGARVSFTAKVEASKDDETFGFFNRPTKPSLLEEGK